MKRREIKHLFFVGKSLKSVGNLYELLADTQLTIRKITYFCINQINLL